MLKIGPNLDGLTLFTDGLFSAENNLAREYAVADSAVEELAGFCLRTRFEDLRFRDVERTDENIIRNSGMVGATGGVLPNNWVESIPAGLSSTISASSTSGGLIYIDYKINGTATTDGIFSLWFESLPEPSTSKATNNQEWVASVFLARQAGTVSTIPDISLNLVSRDGASVLDTFSTNLTALASGALVRYEAQGFFTNPATLVSNMRITHTVVYGTTYDYTLRIAAPQLEQATVGTIGNYVASQFILTNGTDPRSQVRGRPSLCIVPSLYKSGRLYSNIPPSAAGDFTVTRATTATRVNSSGLIEVAKTNLALQSEGFEVSGTWAPTNISVSTGTTAAFTAPDGSTDADLLTATASGSARIIQSFSFVSGTTYTYSAFAKAGSGFFGLTMENGGVASGAAVIWNLNTGAVAVSGTQGTGYALQSQGIENYGNGWYRCRMTVLMSVSIAGTIRANTSDGTMITTVIQSASGNTAYVWGAQLEVGSTASEYIPTTTVARTRFAGVDVNGTVASGVPRIDWLGQSCPALLVEPSATNGILNSNNTTTDWTLGANLSGTAIDAIGVSGRNITVVSGGSDLGSAAGRLVRFSNNVALASGSTYTISFLMKKTGAHTIGGYQFFIGTGSIAAGFDVSGSFSSGSISDTAPTTNRIRRIEQFGTDVFRCSETFTMTAAATGTHLAFAPVAGVTNGNNSAVGTSMGFAAPQIELGSVPTTFIPTTTAAATRNADAITASGALVSGLIGQTEGTIYAEVDIRNMAKETYIIRVDDGTNTNQINLRTISTNVVRNFIAASQSGGTLAISSAAFSSGIVKVALAYKSGDIALSVNGATALTAVGTFTFGSSLTRMSIGDNAGGIQLNDRIRAAALYTTRLTNAQLEQLTA